MTVADLIDMLQRCNEPDSVVKIYDGDSEQMEEVTGCLYGGKDGVVELLSGED